MSVDRTPVTLPLAIDGTTILVVRDLEAARAALPGDMTLEAAGGGPEEGYVYARLSVGVPLGVDAAVVDAAVDAIRGQGVFVMRVGRGAIVAAEPTGNAAPNR